jgi:ribosome-binding factor A
MSQRIEKINALLKNYLAEIFQKDLSLKQGIFISVSKIDTTSDLRYARVFLSIYPIKEENYVFKTLEKEKFKIQNILNKKMNIKILPKIVFKEDDTQEKVAEIEKIFQEIEKEKKH